MGPLDATVDRRYAPGKYGVPAVPGPMREDEIAGLKTHLAQAFAALAAGAPYPSVGPRGAHAHLCDEARIMRFLFICGPQPGIDIGARKPLTVVGREAGCRDRSRVDSYLEQLCALGLVSFSRSALPDERRYAALEAQREVAAALRHVNEPAAQRRSLALTRSGLALCRRCSIRARSPVLV